MGLGNMGHAMASNLIKNKIKLFTYNRSKDKAQDLIKSGAEFVTSPKDMFKKTRIVFSMLANDDALHEVTVGKNGLLEGSVPDTIHVSMSTVSPELVKDLHKEHQKKKVHFMSAPVFGRPDVAAQQKLWICLAGDPKIKEQVKPFLNCMGQKVYDFGDVPELANITKISGNFLILSCIEAMAEAFAFAEKSGVNIQDFSNFLGESLFPSPVIKTYGQLLVSQKFEPAGFKMELGLKDVNLLLQQANALNVPLPIASLLHNRLLTGIANERGDKDWSAIALSSFEDAGLQREVLVHSDI